MGFYSTGPKIKANDLKVYPIDWRVNLIDDICLCHNNR